MKIKYQNEIIRRQVKENSTFFELIIVAIIISIAMVSASFIMTYTQNKKQPHIPFEELAGSKSAYNSIYYGYVVGEPEKLAEGYYGVRMDDYHFILHVSDSYVKYKINSEIEEKKSSKIHGSIMILNKDEHEDTCQKISEFYNKNNNPVYTTDHGYRYLEVMDGTLLSETITAHPLGLIFGITGFILEAMMIFWSGTLKMIKYLRPKCGSRRYTDEEIDEQANMPDSVWLSSLGIFLAPEIMIGIRKGITVVEYGDISLIKVTSSKQLIHTGNSGGGSYEIDNIYHIIVETKQGKKLKFSDSTLGMGLDYDTVYKTCRECNPDVVIKEIK